MEETHTSRFETVYQPVARKILKTLRTEEFGTELKDIPELKNLVNAESENRFHDILNQLMQEKLVTYDKEKGPEYPELSEEGKKIADNYIHIEEVLEGETE